MGIAFGTFAAMVRVKEKNMVDPTTRGAGASGDILGAECEAIASRRVFVYADGKGPEEKWGLALSGGGIRSATFCLGVLQALAKAPFQLPGENGPLPGAPDAPQLSNSPKPSDPAWPLLARFDFLSTVSGGGYIGGFFSALFRAREQAPGEPVSAPAPAPTELAREAYAALATDPPGRLGKDTAASATALGKEPDRPLRWLRENGRYLAPNNTGDLLYDAGIAIRNLCAVHYVLGVTLLFVFLLMYALRHISVHSEWIGAVAQALESKLQPQQLPLWCGEIWFSPWFGVLGIWLLLAVIPCGVAYWLDQDKPSPKAKAPVLHPALAAAALLALGIFITCHLGSKALQAGTGLVSGLLDLPAPIILLALMDVALAVSLLVFFAAKYGPLLHLPKSFGLFDEHIRQWLADVRAARRPLFPAPLSSRLFRNRMTRWLSNVLTASLVVGLLALVETAGQTLYLWLTMEESAPFTVFSVAGAVTALVALVRQFAPLLAQPGKDGWLSKLPLNAILGIVGLALVLLLAVAWNCVAAALLFGMQPPAPGPAKLVIDAMFTQTGSRLGLSEAMQCLYPAFLMLFCLVATVAAGYFLGFINLSSLQLMYSARLTRAYLGASNQKRFDPKAPKMDVTEADQSDDFQREVYYRNNHLGPAHLVNVTINATTGTGDQLTQRDRQGLPLAVTPAGITVNGRLWDCSAGDFARTRPEAANADGSLTARIAAKAKALAKALRPPPPELSMGQWMGVSGAAFSTGLGRGTSLGQAMLFTITNIRLGWWWDSGKKDARKISPRWRNQAYLLRELRARFLGTDGSHWYLSDGGHFENTGVFELLRRKVGFIVCCDCGADPSYTFEDLSNLMRLARIDFGAEFECVGPTAFTGFSANVKDYFAADEAELCAPAGTEGKLAAAPDDKCALLYRVSYAGCKDKTFLLVLKPRLIQSAPLDLFEYQVKNPSFPQQTTFDQFFDEAQWESYRKLGVLIGSRIFQ